MHAKYEIDSSALTLRDALDIAILIEEQARERYTEYVDLLESHHTPEAAAFFRRMVRSETRHREWLTVRRRQLFGDEPSRVDATMLPEVESPPLAEALAIQTVRQALAAALQAEIRAEHYFARALKEIRDPHVRELFEELRVEEVEHQRMVQVEIDRLPGA